MRKRVRQEEIAGMCLELSLLLHAGVGTGDGLTLLAEDGDEVLRELAEQVDGGVPLSTALAESGVFPRYVSGLVRAGERTGRTEQALSGLSRYYEERVRLGRRIREALVYPAVLLALMLAVIGVLLVKVLPIFEEVYATLGSGLSGAAGGLLELGRWLGQWLPVLWGVLAVLAILIVCCALCRPLRSWIQEVWRRSLGDRGVWRKLNNARVAQALAMGLAGGLPPEEALELCAGLAEGGARARCEECRRELAQGAGLGQALEDSGVLSPGRRRLLELGERSGSGDAVMEKIARDVLEEGESALAALVGRVEPGLVVVCSVLVGVILLSVMLPLMNIMAAIG